jgi:hypothetical protein
VVFATYGPGVSLAGGGVQVILGNGMGGFTLGPFIPLRPRGAYVTTGDYNQDSKMDIAAISFGGSCIPGDCSGALQILFGDGAGNFTTTNVLTQTSHILTDLVTGDMSNDGKPDLIGTQGNSVVTLLNTGAGDFVSGGGINVGGSNLNGTKVADFNNDGKLDAALVATNSNLAYIAFGNGLGGFTNFFTFGVGTDPYSLTIADFNLNGNRDLAVVNEQSSNVTVLIDPNGSTLPRRAMFDFDGDNKADIAVYREGNTANAPSYWHILNSSNGAYQGIQLGANGDKPVPADYNGDGRTEVAVWRPSNGTWYTSTNPAINYGAFQWGVEGDVPAPAHYDLDAKADFAIFRPGSSTWYILRSTDGTAIGQKWGVPSDRPVPSSFIP